MSGISKAFKLSQSPLKPSIPVKPGIPQSWKIIKLENLKVILSQNWNIFRLKYLRIDLSAGKDQS